MKTFEDLKFEEHPLSKNPYLTESYKDAKNASMTFDNGYGISVLFGRNFYSNGEDTYEVAVLKDDKLCYDTEITNDVLGGQTKEMVTEVMIKIQKLKE